MKIRDGGYYKQRNGLIRGPMIVVVGEGYAIEGRRENKTLTKWKMNGEHFPRQLCAHNERIDLVEEVVVFPMPELSPRDNTVASDDDGYILEFVMDYQADSDDDGLYLFTRGRLLDMLKVRDGYNKRMVSLNLTLDTSEAREDLRKALEQMSTGIAHLAPVTDVEFKNINPTRIEDFASVLADSIANGLTVHAFENDLNAGLAINGHIDVITNNISARLITFLRAEGVNVYYDGGIVKGPAKTAMSEAPSLRSNETTAADAMAEVLLNSPVMKEVHRALAKTGMSEVTTEEAEDFLGIPRKNAKSWADGGFTGKPGLSPQVRMGWMAPRTGRKVTADDFEALHLAKPAPTPTPTPGSVWLHRNGNRYAVVMIANGESERQEKYPTTVVYRNISNGNVYSRKLSDWHRSMTEVGASA